MSRGRRTNWTHIADQCAERDWMVAHTGQPVAAGNTAAAPLRDHNHTSPYDRLPLSQYSV
jgi:hypothetical protein